MRKATKTEAAMLAMLVGAQGAVIRRLTNNGADETPCERHVHSGMAEFLDQVCAQAGLGMFDLTKAFKAGVAMSESVYAGELMIMNVTDLPGEGPPVAPMLLAPKPDGSKN